MRRKLTAAAVLSLALLAGCDSTEINSVYIEPDTAASLPMGDDAGSDLSNAAAPVDPAAANAAKARALLEEKPYSESALSLLLRTEHGMTEQAAAAAVSACGADWYEQSVRAAFSLLRTEFFSRDALADRLAALGFTEEQANYGADNAGLDEIAQALEKAKSYLEFSSFSQSGLVKQLMNEGFTEEQAQSAANNCGADWSEQAALTASFYTDFRDFTREEMIERLLSDGFTEAEAKHGADSAGL